MSSDMTVVSPVHQVETLEDIVSREFEHIVPRFIPQSGMLNAFDQEPIGSPSVYRRIYDKALDCERRGQNPFLRFKSDGLSDLSKFMKYTDKSANSAILHSSSLINYI